MQFNKKTKFILIISIALLTYLIIYLNCIGHITNIYSQYRKNNLIPESRIYNLILESECSCKNKNEQIQINIKNNYYQVYMNNMYKYSFNLNNTNLTCNLYNSLRRGMNQKVISYSLYGQNRFYYRYLPNITKQIKTLYPEWIIRIYHDNTLNYCEVECQLDDDIIDFCNIEKFPNISVNYMHKMNWRWLPIGDSFVDVFNARDTDSAILQRELDSVQYWLLKSNKTAHIMRGYFIYLVKNNLYKLLNYICYNTYR
jgi:hypothetical protein